MKKATIKGIIGILIILAIWIVGGSINYNNRNESRLVLQFGSKVVDVKNDVGIFLTIPFIQSTHRIYTGENLYDLPKSDVITSDKKTMTADCYSIWEIKDPLKFYQTVTNESVAESRLNVAIYNSMKNIISSTTQMNVIGGKDGSLGDTIRDNVRLANQYGIDISEVEMKLLDLPEENKNDVYARMISERNVIKAQYDAEGEKVYKTKKSEIDAQVRQIKSNAEVEAASIEAEAEAKYYNILANAYSASPDRRAFYNYLIGLEALQDSLSEGGTVNIDKTSPLYAILNNDVLDTSNVRDIVEEVQICEENEEDQVVNEQ